MSIDTELAAIGRIGERLSLASNSDLEALVDKLLPKLLLLSTQDTLKNDVVRIVLELLDRVKLLNIALPSVQLLNLVRPQNRPSCCNLSLEFIHITFTRQNYHKPEIISDALVEALASFDDPFSETFSNLLNLMLNLVGTTLASLSHRSNIDNTKCMVGDWILDLFFAQNGLARRGVGSIKAGLSDDRVDRLTIRNQVLRPEELKGFKLTILNSLIQGSIPSSHLFVICCVGRCDNDEVISTSSEVTLRKLRNTMSMTQDAAKEVILYSLALCIGRKDALLDMDTKYDPFRFGYRSSIPAEVKVSLLRFLNKDMCQHFDSISFQMTEMCLQIIEDSKLDQEGLSGGNSPLVVVPNSLKSVTLSILLSLCNALSDESLSSYCDRIMSLILKCLSPFRHFIDKNDQEAFTLRQVCCVVQIIFDTIEPFPYLILNRAVGI